MKTKLFSKRSLLVSLKGLASTVMAQISVFPLWLIAIFIMRKGLLVLGSVFSIVTFIIGFLFFGYWSTRWWGWK